MGTRRLYSLVRSITEPSPASAETAPRPQSDAGAIRRMFPVKYTPKKELPEGGE